MGAHGHESRSSAPGGAMNRRSLQRPRSHPLDAPEIGHRTLLPGDDIAPDSRIARAIARCYQNHRHGDYTVTDYREAYWHLVQEGDAYIADRLAEVWSGRAESLDAIHWADRRGQFTGADRDLVVQYVTVFLEGGRSAYRALDWWTYFINPWRSLSYMRAGRTSLAAALIFDRILPERRFASAAHDPADLRLAHAWTMSRVDVRRIRRYLDAGVTLQEAREVWEPRASAGEDVDAALDMLAALIAAPSAAGGRDGRGKQTLKGP
jgi:hypothetical protein